MSTSALTIAGAVKEAWTDTELQKQFEDRNSPLSALETARWAQPSRRRGRRAPRNPAI